MEAPPRLIRVFLSSPGDVKEERQLARSAIEHLNSDPLLSKLVHLEVIAWDQDPTGMPMLAHMTPQRAIDQGLRKPSDCDIVAVLFKHRMGTPLPYPEYKKANGEPFLSGTEWEYEDAIQVALMCDYPKVLVYRCTQEPVIGLRDPERDEIIKQWERLEAFFAKFSDLDTRAILRGFNTYESPDDFARKFEDHMRKLIAQLVESGSSTPISASEPSISQSLVQKADYAFRQNYWSLCYELTRDILIAADSPKNVDCKVHYMRLVALVRLGHISAIKRSLDVINRHGEPSQQARIHLEIAKYYLSKQTPRIRYLAEIREHLEQAVHADAGCEEGQESSALLQTLS
ncbi:MAG: DUF4062 domain-containing protein [Anaerolineae bacterium]|nr:DUF4062 domain-containing protein [Anaerolineae bacterium]